MSFPFPALAGLLAQATAAPTDLSLAQRLADLFSRLRGDEGKVLLYLAAGQFVVMLAYWLSSKAFAEERATFSHAMKVYFLYLLTTVIASVLLFASAVILPVAISTFRSGPGVGPAVTILGFSVLVLAVVGLSIYFFVLIPMRVYRLWFGEALFFLGVSALITWVGHFGLRHLIHPPMAAKYTVVQEWWKQNAASGKPLLVTGGPLVLGEEATYAALEQRAADRTKTIEERHTALKDLHDQLAVMRLGLKPGDATARGEYEKRKARYEGLLNELRAEVAAGGKTGP